MMVQFRPYQADDLDALYAISLATGHVGADASVLYRDGRLVGHIYSAPYARLAPEMVLVAEDADGVAGYVAGALDTSAWRDRLERCWWPELRRAYPVPERSEKEQWTPDTRRVAMIHTPESAPGTVLRDYPAHLHLNLLPRLQGSGIGRKLLFAWFDRTMHDRIIATHVGVNRANTRALQFWAKMGFHTISPDQPQPSRTVWMGRARRDFRLSWVPDV